MTEVSDVTCRGPEILGGMPVFKGIPARRWRSSVRLRPIATLNLGDPESAASWYLRAGQHSKAGGWPYLYANLVISNDLAAHYERALEAVRAAQGEWRRKHWLIRVASQLLSLRWLRPHMWRIVPRQRFFAAELERRLRLIHAA